MSQSQIVFMAFKNSVITSRKIVVCVYVSLAAEEDAKNGKILRLKCERNFAATMDVSEGLNFHFLSVLLHSGIGECGS